jgi:hypothetical protein
MFTEIYVAIQQGQVLQHRVVEEAGQARRGWRPGRRHWQRARR